MAKKSYGIENLSFNDYTRNEDYILIRNASNVGIVNFPVDMPECNYMFPSELTELICDKSNKS